MLASQAQHREDTATRRPILLSAIIYISPHGVRQGPDDPGMRRAYLLCHRERGGEREVCEREKESGEE